MIEFQNISLCLNGKMILQDVSFCLHKGETVLLVGSSGAGKSTILKLALRLMLPTSGKILVEGRNILELSDSELMKLRQRFGMVFQGGALFDSLTVEENVAFFLKENLKLPKDEICSRITDKLEFLGLDNFKDYNVSELSGGMRKRVAIARAMVTNPHVLFYDEPTAGLDPFSANRVVELISDLREKYQVTSLIISHEIQYFVDVADRLLMLKGGQITYEGKPDMAIADHFGESETPEKCDTRKKKYGIFG